MLYFTAFWIPYIVNNFFFLYAFLFLSYITQLIYIFSQMLYITAFPYTVNNLFPVMLYFTAFSYTVNNLFPVCITLVHSLVLWIICFQYALLFTGNFLSSFAPLCCFGHNTDKGKNGGGYHWVLGEFSVGIFWGNGQGIQDLVSQSGRVVSCSQICSVRVEYERTRLLHMMLTTVVIFSLLFSSLHSTYLCSILESLSAALHWV
jgi:hypothetical protein